MQVDFNKIKEIYGEETLGLIVDNLDNVLNNLKYFESLGFTDSLDIFERSIFSFIDEPSYFKNKLNKLILNLGVDYVNIIENDISILEELEW